MSKKKSFKIVVAFLSLLFIGLISNTIITEANNNCYEPGCRVTIRDIVAHDSMRGYVPSTVREILDYAHNRNVPPGRTGWSAYELECTNNKWYKTGIVTNTDDSGRDKYYAVSEYAPEIIAKYGVKAYEAALASGQSLKYQSGSKYTLATSGERKWTPCRNGEFGGYYNDQQFSLQMSFTIPRKPSDPLPPPQKPDVENPPCENNCGSIEEPEFPEIIYESCGEFWIEPEIITIWVAELAQYRAYYSDPCYPKPTIKKDVTDIAGWWIEKPHIGETLGEGKYKGLGLGFSKVYAGLNVSNGAGEFQYQDDAELIVKEPTFKWNLTSGSIDKTSFDMKVDPSKLHEKYPVNIKGTFKGKFTFTERFNKATLNSDNVLFLGATSIYIYDDNVDTILARGKNDEPITGKDLNIQDDGTFTFTREFGLELSGLELMGMKNGINKASFNATLGLGVDYTNTQRLLIYEPTQAHIEKFGKYFLDFADFKERFNFDPKSGVAFWSSNADFNSPSNRIIRLSDLNSSYFVKKGWSANGTSWNICDRPIGLESCDLTNIKTAELYQASELATKTEAVYVPFNINIENGIDGNLGMDQALSWELTGGSIDKNTFNLSVVGNDSNKITGTITGKFKFSDAYPKERVENMSFSGFSTVTFRNPNNYKEYKTIAVNDSDWTIVGRDMNIQADGSFSFKRSVTVSKMQEFLDSHPELQAENVVGIFDATLGVASEGRSKYFVYAPSQELVDRFDNFYFDINNSKTNLTNSQIEKGTMIWNSKPEHVNNTTNLTYYTTADIQNKKTVVGKLNANPTTSWAFCLEIENGSCKTSNYTVNDVYKKTEFKVPSNTVMIPFTVEMKPLDRSNMLYWELTDGSLDTSEISIADNASEKTITAEIKGKMNIPSSFGLSRVQNMEFYGNSYLTLLSTTGGIKEVAKIAMADPIYIKGNQMNIQSNGTFSFTRQIKISDLKKYINSFPETKKEFEDTEKINLIFDATLGLAKEENKNFFVYNPTQEIINKYGDYFISRTNNKLPIPTGEMDATDNPYLDDNGTLLITQDVLDNKKTVIGKNPALTETGWANCQQYTTTDGKKICNLSDNATSSQYEKTMIQIKANTVMMPITVTDSLLTDDNMLTWDITNIEIDKKEFVVDIANASTQYFNANVTVEGEIYLPKDNSISYSDIQTMKFKIGNTIIRREPLPSIEGHTLDSWWSDFIKTPFHSNIESVNIYKDGEKIKYSYKIPIEVDPSLKVDIGGEKGKMNYLEYYGVSENYITLTTAAAIAFVDNHGYFVQYPRKTSIESLNSYYLDNKSEAFIFNGTPITALKGGIRYSSNVGQYRQESLVAYGYGYYETSYDSLNSPEYKEFEKRILNLENSVSASASTEVIGLDWASLSICPSGEEKYHPPTNQSYWTCKDDPDVKAHEDKYTLRGYGNNAAVSLKVKIIDSSKPPEPDPLPPYEGRACSVTINLNLSDTKTKQYMQADPIGTITESSESSEFDVLNHSIPSSEYLKVFGESEKYLADYNFEKYTGTAEYTIEAAKDFKLTWKEPEETDDEGNVTSPSVPHAEIERKIVEIKESHPISFWKIGHLLMYKLEDITFKNYALPNESVVVKNDKIVVVDTRHEPNNEKHVIIKDCQSIHLGEESIDGGETRPEIPDITNEAQAKANETKSNRVPDVFNDKVVVDGTTYMDDKVVPSHGPTAQDIPPAPKVSVQKQSLQIDPKKANRYKSVSSITALYNVVASVNKAGSDLSFTGNSPLKINEVTVHTPTVIYAQASDDKEHDQRINPPLRSEPPNPNSDRHAFILDRPFKVIMPTTGQHLNIPGYGNRDFAKYIKKKEVKFPFEVYNATKTAYYPKDTWIDVPVNSYSAEFFMPVWVKEGEYEIEFRTFAINALDKGDFGGSEHEANTKIPNGIVNGYPSAAHVATDKIKVDVVGRLYDLNISDINDFNWKYQFVGSDGYTRLGNRYYVGLKDIDGSARGNTEPYTLPVNHTSNTNGIQNQAVKLGYSFKFDLKTKGDMDSKKDSIQIKPTFYFVNKDGTGRQKVDLYYHDKEKLFVKIGSNEDKQHRTVKLNVRERSVPQEQLKNNATHYFNNAAKFDLQDVAAEHTLTSFNRFYNRTLSKQDVKTGSYAKQTLNWNLRTYRGPLESQLPPITTSTTVPKKDIVTKEQTWYGEYSLPQKTYAVKAGTKIGELGLLGNLNDNHPVFLKDGYIIVNFDIETIQEGDESKPYLSYYNSMYMNPKKQWGLEGGKASFKDAYNNTFSVLKGDMIYYHADQSSLDDLSQSVTH